MHDGQSRTPVPTGELVLKAKRKEYKKPNPVRRDVEDAIPYGLVDTWKKSGMNRKNQTQNKREDDILPYGLAENCDKAE